ncbi:hypothetical protein EDB84DRAFT_1573182 [Lactarius hengduanensis]|nr:hypothetical protein EDB84DRAFT_1573182 [Lactarius hengduanensis]
MIEADLYEDAPLTHTQDTVQELRDLFVSRPDLRGDIMDEMQRPTATTASWEGPNTFDSATVKKRTPRRKRKPLRTPDGLRIPATPTQWTLPPEEDEPELKLSATINWINHTTTKTSREEDYRRLHHEGDPPPSSPFTEATWPPTHQPPDYSPSRLELPSNTPFTAIPTPHSPRSPMTDEEFADRLAEMEIRRVHAVKAQDWKAVQDLDFRANLAKAVRTTMRKSPRHWKKSRRELQKTETRLARALINGTATDIRRLDCGRQ